MTAKHVYTYSNPTRPRDLELASQILARGGIVAYPTELNWAFGFDPKSAEAIQRVHRIKYTHPKDRPFSLVCSGLAMASEIGQIDHWAYRYLKKALPGPFTVILKCLRTVPRHIRDTRKVVGIRIPDSPLVMDLIAMFGGPFATTSVPKHTDPLNPDEDPMPLKFGHQVMEYYGGMIDLVLDLGDELPGDETSIISLVDGAPELVRRGAGDPSIFGITEGHGS